MGEVTEAVSGPRYWKINVNPEECPQGAWELFQSTGLAMLGMPGEAGEASYAVRNLKQVREGDWLVAYTPQEGAYTVGGVGRVTRGYRCEKGPFEHPWEGPVRRSVAVEWKAGACRIADLVKDGRFRKGKIPRILDEIFPAEFEPIRERVFAADAPGTPAVEESARETPAPEPHPTIGVHEREAIDSLLSLLTPSAAAPGGPAPGEEPGQLEFHLSEEAAALAQREAQLLSSFSTPDAAEGVLDFGLPTPGDEALDSREEPATSRPEVKGEPFAVRVGSLGWSGLFRREVESGRPCSLLLRGPQYAFLNTAPPDTVLRGLRLFALFAIGAVAAPGKEAFRSGAMFVFRGRRPSGDYEIEVRPRPVMPVFREPAEVGF